MKYREFRDSPLAKQHGVWWILTLIRSENDPASDCRVAVLQWEPSNSKWYRPQPFEMREEAGYVNEVWLEDGGNHKIIHMRPVFSCPADNGEGIERLRKAFEEWLSENDRSLERYPANNQRGPAYTGLYTDPDVELAWCAVKDVKR